VSSSGAPNKDRVSQVSSPPPTPAAAQHHSPRLQHPSPCSFLAGPAFAPRSRNTHSTQPKLSLPLCLTIAEDIHRHFERRLIG